MTTLQLLNVFLIGLFCGFLNAYFAQKRGKNPKLWFGLGLFFGLFALAILFLLPKHSFRREPRAVERTRATTAPKRSDSHLKRWFYLDGEQRQVGPMEFTDLSQTFSNKKIDKESFIWGEGMAEWKKLEELPELTHELELLLASKK